MINANKISKAIKENYLLKQMSARVLITSRSARPRWWVRKFIFPIHRQYGKGSSISKNARLDILPFNSFNIGERVFVEDGVVINNGMGEVNIADDSFIGINSTLIGPVQIGRSCMLAQNVVISGINHGYKDINTAPIDQKCTASIVQIEDDVWIGANSIINAGTTIGKHSVIGAGSVVTKDVEPFCVVVGNPAKMIKKFNFKKNIWETV